MSARHERADDAAKSQENATGLQTGKRIRLARWFSLVLSLAVLAGFLLAFFNSGPWLRAADWARAVFHTIDRRLYAVFGWPLTGTPNLARFDERLKEKGLTLGAPVFIRIFKQEYSLELWMRKDNRFVLFATYPICTYSGGLGPKLTQGDRQAPEGFYTVSRAQLNPNSRWHRSFNLGYPNAFDASYGRTGSLIMVHGGCSSIGCYAMTNPVIDEIWRVINAAFDHGQERIAVHVFPFRMTDERLAAYEASPWAGFWRDLKSGYDLFEALHVPPVISICQKHYIAEPGTAESANSPLRNVCPSQMGNMEKT